MKYRVAITGLGIISTLGLNIDAVAQSLYAGRSGITADPQRKALGFGSCLTGALPSFTPAHLSRKQCKTMPDFAQWAAEACFQAVAQACLEPESLQNERTGVIFGCDSSVLAAVEQTSRLEQSKDTAALGSGLVFRSMTSCVSMNLSTIFKTQGAAWTLSAACASSAHAVGQAADLIALGRQDRLLCGGAQEINWQSMCSFDALGAFSKNEASPSQASRPFDKARDGLVPSGGAAALLLERHDLAQRRGVPILGEVTGYGFSSDGQSLVVPDSTGISRAMRAALACSQTHPREIDYICAHATSTPQGDAAEAQNILDLFPDKTVPVSSTKSMTGHELWMSGAAQAVYCTIMAQRGFLAPNLNFSEPDDFSGRLDIIAHTRQTGIKTALCNAAGFGGTNATLLLRF